MADCSPCSASFLARRVLSRLQSALFPFIFLHLFNFIQFQQIKLLTYCQCWTLLGIAQNRDSVPRQRFYTRAVKTVQLTFHQQGITRKYSVNCSSPGIQEQGLTFYLGSGLDNFAYDYFIFLGTPDIRQRHNGTRPITLVHCSPSRFYLAMD